MHGVWAHHLLLMLQCASFGICIIFEMLAIRLQSDYSHLIFCQDFCDKILQQQSMFKHRQFASVIVKACYCPLTAFRLLHFPLQLSRHPSIPQPILGVCAHQLHNHI